MGYIFSLEPTFTQGLILGQLSILCLLVLVLKYLFLETTDASVEEEPRYSRATHNHIPPQSRQSLDNQDEDVKPVMQAESAEWFNALFLQVRLQPRGSHLVLIYAKDCRNLPLQIAQPSQRH
jgi:maintenance of morphology protein 1